MLKTLLASTLFLTTLAYGFSPEIIDQATRQEQQEQVSHTQLLVG